MSTALARNGIRHPKCEELLVGKPLGESSRKTLPEKKKLTFRPVALTLRVVRFEQADSFAGLFARSRYHELRVKVAARC